MGKKVVVIGGALQGCELAEFLVKRGRNVTIVEQAEMLGDGMIDAVLGNLMIWFEKKGVRMISGVKEYVEITDRGLTHRDRRRDDRDPGGRHLRLGTAADVQRGSSAGAEGEGGRGLPHR